MSGLVLIVDDEVDLVSTLDYNLEREGFRTRVAYDGKSGLTLARKHPLPDLILLDLMLPDIPGTEVCKILRSEQETRSIPVIMQTAKGDEIDRVVGFEVGADDYLVKPYSMREMILRLRAIQRRSSGPALASSNQIVFGGLRVDLIRHQAWLEDSEISLTALEFKLLTTLLTRKGRVQSRKALLDDVWGIQGDTQTRTVDTHIKRLRQKLGSAGDSIETLRGVGYRFRSTESPSSSVDASNDHNQDDELEGVG